MTETRPKRIQRRRVKGWKMPPNTVYVGRPSVYGNPYVFRKGDSHELFIAVEDYRKWILACGPRAITDIERIRTNLRGKNLACWCPLDQSCHADVLLEIAND